MNAVEVAPTLVARIAAVRENIEAAARRSRRSAQEITLVAVSKTHSPGAVLEASAAGLLEFGENRVQEAESKIPAVGRERVRWHLIGHLQSNKARRAVELFDVIHSLDSAALARRLDRVCEEIERAELPVLIQVDLGHESTKTGIDEKELPELIKVVKECKHLRLKGLMTLPPFFDESAKIRPYFSRLRSLRDDLKSSGAFGDEPGELSMGMTHDYEVAIEEGATMLRIGTAIFGERERQT